MPEKRSRDANNPTGRVSFMDAIAVLVGLVVGAGIFRTPSLIAANSTSELDFLGSWLLGGIASLIGALCYAELCTSFPSRGGDYHFLQRAFGDRLGFLFAWSRMSVVQTGSIALLAYISGDYLQQLFNLGEHGPALYAASVIGLLTLVNCLGIQYGTRTQNLLTLLEISGIIAIVIAAWFANPALSEMDNVPAHSEASGTPSFSLAMVFVLLTYGGWNEVAYLSAELKSGKRQMVTLLVTGIFTITLIYLLVNYAYLKLLGLSGIAASEAVGAEVMHLAFGETGAILISVLVLISAVTSANATIFTGARTNYALGQNVHAFRYLGQWNDRVSAPIPALLVQSTIAIALIGLGSVTRSGFETMIEYTAPVFWSFFFLTGISLFILRKKYPDQHRPFRVPLYPVLPALFCLISAYLLYSSLQYTGIGALVGVGVLGIGILILFFIQINPLKE